MREHVEAVWGWDEADQRERFRAGFDPSGVSVIMSADQPIGLLKLDRRADEVFLASVELAPEVQGRGLGTDIVRSVLCEAAERGVPVRLQVFHRNPARRLYERLGFRPVGETPTHLEMLHESDKDAVTRRRCGTSSSRSTGTWRRRTTRSCARCSRPR
ncbi:MAG: GNAT family N-acetyltransferase [Deltaproteobacteria bacterium]|nr:GNAT family N-acetyltransferase [Deltaproteobacteria bacterium]